MGRGPERIYLQRTHKWPTGTETSRISREKKTKASRSSLLTPVRMAIIKTSGDHSCGENVEEGDPCALSVGMQSGAAALGNSAEGP